jgi:transposase
MVISQNSRGKSTTEISENLGIKRSTVYSILKVFNSEGLVSPKKRGGDFRSILSEEDKQLVRSWVDENPTKTIKSIVSKFLDEKGTCVDDNTIDRCLKNFHYTFKNLVLIPERRNTEGTIRQRFEYANEFFQLMIDNEDKNFIFVDEVGFCVTSRTKRVICNWM